MCNNFVRDPAGVASDTRRIKNHRAMITLGFGRAVVFLFVFLFVFVFVFVSLFDFVGLGLLVDLSSGYLWSHEQAGVVLSDIRARDRAKAAIAACRLVVAFGISKGIVLPGQQRKPIANSVQENVGGL